MLSDLEVARYVNEVAQVCGGSEPLQDILGHLENVFRVLSPDRLTGTLSLALQLTPSPVPFADQAFDEVSSVSALSVLLGATEDILIEVMAGGSMRYWVGAYTQNNEDRIVYTYKGPSQEAFIVADVEVTIPPLDGHLSRYAVPYFSSLEAALDNYAEQCARLSQCPRLRNAWRDDTRLIFAPKPEHHMRDSLIFWLRNTLRGHSEIEVMPEQNVNASRPVDIKVHWSVGRQISMMEVKWLGKSAKENATSWGSQYPASRAQEGLEQLATYLDLYRAEAPHFDARGHLVVFDGRREGLALTGAPLPRSKAFKHQHNPPNYDSALLRRSDMGSPKRFFLEPDEKALSA